MTVNSKNVWVFIAELLKKLNTRLDSKFEKEIMKTAVEVCSRDNYKLMISEVEDEEE